MKQDKCLLVGLTVRPLAESAAKGGIEVYTVDLFADQDTVQAANQSKIAKFNGVGFEESSLIEAVNSIDPECKLSVVYGGGFECNPELLKSITMNRDLFGVEPEKLSRICSPLFFFNELELLGIPFPETQLIPPKEAEGWIVKMAGGSGGTHIKRLRDDSDHTTAQAYYQRYQSGRSISATICSSKSDCTVIGYSEQWCANNLFVGEFAYGGAVSISPDEIHAIVKNEIKQAAKSLSMHFGLKGLLTLDVVIDGDQWYLLEVNPRPGATFELHEGKTSYLQMHVNACRNSAYEVASQTSFGVFKAHSIVYARKQLRIPEKHVFENWVKDRPHVGAAFEPGEPVCTIYANRSSSVEAKRVVTERHKVLDSLFETVDYE